MKHRKSHKAAKNTSYANPAWERVKARFRKIDRKELTATVLWFLSVFLFYTVCNFFEWTFHVVLYPLALGLLAGGYLLLNGGTFARDAEPDPDRFPASWDEERRKQACERFARNRKWARKLLPPLFAVMATLCIDLIYLNVVTA